MKLVLVIEVICYFASCFTFISLYERYYFSAADSPHLKPIEKCFSLIKRYIDLMVDGDNLSPIDKINRAFHDY